MIATDTDAPVEQGPRLLVDDCRHITAAQLLAHYGRPAPEAGVGPIPIRFRSRGMIIHVAFVATSQRLGLRWWLKCPMCSDRAAILYSPRSLETPDFACRRCWNLSYRSQLT